MQIYWWLGFHVWNCQITVLNWKTWLFLLRFFLGFFVCLFVCLLLEYFLICYLHFIIVSKFGSVNLFKIFQGEVNIKQILGKVANRKSQHFNPRKMYPTNVYSFSSITPIKVISRNTIWWLDPDSSSKKIEWNLFL